jgi:hypothetical protein
VVWGGVWLALGIRDRANRYAVGSVANTGAMGVYTFLSWTPESPIIIISTHAENRLIAVEVGPGAGGVARVTLCRPGTSTEEG